MNLPVYFTNEIKDRINYIKYRNQNSPDALSQWSDYMKWIFRFISNPSVAWDYAGKYVHNSEGVIFFNDFGYDISYIVRIDDETGQAFVSVIYIDLNLAEFGLRESKQRKELLLINESQLRRIIREAIRKIIA